MSKMAQVNEIIGFLLKKMLTPAGKKYYGRSGYFSPLEAMSYP
jgi:hypothetical protein